MAEEQPPTELKLDKSNLYREETFSDLKVGIIKRMTPVKSDGSVDKTRKSVFVGQTSLMTPGGPLPLQAVIQADRFFRSHATPDPGRFPFGQAMTTGAWIDDAERAFDTLFSDFLAATSTIIGLGDVMKLLQRFLIDFQSVILVHDHAIPLKAKPL